jgi:hypothetical protein
MRLAALLAELSDVDLERLAAEHVRTDERLVRPQLCNLLEGAIRSYRFISGFITNRQPPTLSILTSLLEARGYERLSEGFEDAVLAEATRLSQLIDRGDLLARDEQLRLYRRTLYEARRNDLDVNASEAALLGVLRREGGISQVEHFLIEHHQDLREFWQHEHCFEHEMHALRSAGIVFFSQGRVLIAEDVAPAVWLALGIDMPNESARRLFGYLNNTELTDVLDAAGSRTSGSKDQRAERVLAEWIQPRAALQSVSLLTLKEICRATDAPSSGNKDELIERIVTHFAQGRDQQEDETVEVRLPEPRHLPQHQFEMLFGILHHQELSDILRRRPELRQTGTKELRIRTLWDAQLSEATLLGELMNRQLEDMLHRLGLRLSGSKSARIERIVEHFSVRSLSGAPEDSSASQAESLIEPASLALSPRIGESQSVFRQRASNPQTLLQPWLEALLNAEGLVRCYATEDANPTKQLKNKLSQAASARNGLLLLLLSNEAAYAKAREALVERWMANDEWPKGVAAVALAYPAGEPAIRSIVERMQSPWSERIQVGLFPEAEVVRVGQDPICCKQCESELPHTARFCPNCGSPARATGHSPT